MTTTISRWVRPSGKRQATRRRPRRATSPALVALLAALATAACARSDEAAIRSIGRANARTSRYSPQIRTITITTVPLLVKEQQGVLPFLKEDFAKGGVLDGKEVYAFSPSTVTVVE